MIAPAELPARFTAWNRATGAPFGCPPARFRRLLERTGVASAVSDQGIRARGAFAWQTNNSIRAFEYPWCAEQIARLEGPLRILDIGGGLGGMQWHLAGEGHTVVNADPGLAAQGRGFELDAETHARVSRALAAPVELVSAPVQTADLRPGSFDVALSISTIEHFSPPDLAALCSHLPRLLRPGGRLIITVDLFLDLFPFTPRRTNEFGRNVDLRELLGELGFGLEAGDPTELFGFEDFDAAVVQSRLSEYLVGVSYPALAQTLVARAAP